MRTHQIQHARDVQYWTLPFVLSPFLTLTTTIRSCQLGSFSDRTPLDVLSLVSRLRGKCPTMHDFVSHILRRYFEATHWNEYNSYLHLTSSSCSVLDFPVPTGLALSISASPTPPFFTTYRLGALPNLHAGIGYIYASTRTPIDFGRSSKDVRLKSIIERFRIVEATRKQTERQYYWLGGQRFEEATGQEEGKEYLVYGCMHVPGSRLDALWTKRLSSTWQLIVTAVSTPPKYPLNALQSAALATTLPSKGGAAGGGLDTSQTWSAPPAPPASTATAAHDAYGLGPPGSTNLQLTLQRDTGRWFTEYSYSVDDALWGFRVLHNFGTDSPSSTGADASESSLPTSARIGTSAIPTSTRIGGEADTDAGGGLRGRFSAGAEVFISTVEKSAGLSTGIRFSTLPDTPSQPIIPPQPSGSSTTPSQPPTVITATLNPMMGHLSTAYAARMARDVVVCSRFDFNVYSYESEWTVGAEYWLRRGGDGSGGASTAELATETNMHELRRAAEWKQPSRAAREAASLSLREMDASLQVQSALATDHEWSLRPAMPPVAPPPPTSSALSSSKPNLPPSSHPSPACSKRASPPPRTSASSGRAVYRRV